MVSISLADSLDRLARRLPRFSRMLALAALLAGPASAQDEDMQGLLALLDNQTELATKSRMNADYVPGMATILHGRDLLARGARTVWEAIGLVPGISLGMEFTGERQVLSRGIGHGYASGNVKILLDGVSMNSTLLATANPVLNLPMEQVERIEVIRGPGSSVHGEYAYAGVVNVITRKQEKGLYLFGERDSHLGGGGMWSWADAQKDLSLSLNLAAAGGDGHGVLVNEDAWHHTGAPELSNAPGPTNEAMAYRSLLMDMQWAGWFAALKFLDDRYGDHFGINHFLPPDDNRLASRHRYHALDLGYRGALSTELDAELRLAYMRHERDRDQLYVYPGEFFTPYPIYMDLTYEERKLLAAVDLHWRPHAQHTWLFSLEASNTRIEEATWTWPALPFPLPATWIDTDRERDILSLVVQDQYRVNDSVTLTGTLRYDDYSDVGSNLSPRLAAVWRLHPEHILKLQYARAFRPPTFFEMQSPGQGELVPSEINTLEFGYIIKKPSWQGRLILFQSDLSDPITFDELNFAGFINADDVHLQGVELEYQQRLGRQLKLDANLSYVDSEFSEQSGELPGGAQWLGNLGLIWQPLADWSTALQIQYVGERSRSNLDPREKLPDTLSLDLTVTYRDQNAGPYVSFGVKNLTDEDIRFPQQLTTDFSGDAFLPYPDDYPRPGRRWWLSAGYFF